MSWFNARVCTDLVKSQSLRACLVPCVKKLEITVSKLFSEIADIEYHATKSMCFYGLKIHVVVTTTGYVLNYDVTPALVHDTQAVATLIASCPCPFVLGDVGDVFKVLKKFAQLGYGL